MGYELCAGVSYCVVRGQTVFLDLKNDRYSRLGKNAEMAFTKLVAGEYLNDSDRIFLKELTKKNLIIESTQEIIPAACQVKEAAVSDYDYFSKRDYRKHLPLALSSLVAARFAIRVWPLWRLIFKIKERKKNCRIEFAEEILHIATAFRHIGIVSTRNDRCLLRSLAMAYHLIWLGYRPEVIFGVNLNPFSAHCWVQSNGIVLNDDCENTQNFTPIMVV